MPHHAGWQRLLRRKYLKEHKQMKKEIIKAVAISVAKEKTPISVIDELFRQLTKEERVLFNNTFSETLEAIRAKRRKEHKENMIRLNKQVEEVKRQLEETRQTIRRTGESKQIEQYCCLLGEA